MWTAVSTHGHSVPVLVDLAEATCGKVHSVTDRCVSVSHSFPSPALIKPRSLVLVSKFSVRLTTTAQSAFKAPGTRTCPITMQF